MKKVELLAPAGSMEALIAAVQNGCDAVYLGGSMFGARAFANNFDEEEMIEAIRYAHGYGVKVYVTMNTLIKEKEMTQALAYAKFLYEQNVDALIIQDLGFFDLVHQECPDFELHASTQMHIHNPQAIAFMKQAGAKRVVVPRETSIEEIAQLAKQGVDLEVFVQGALCVSYSGQCLMSAKKLSRSGNRGECAQMCRMRYKLVKEENGKQEIVDVDGEYLLSPKDLNTLSMVPELLQAGIASFKIEGRMKRPAYVALMVALYRQAIDAFYAHTTYDNAQADFEMRKIFNRDFTSGHLFHQRGRALMNFHRPNHMGIPVGKVSLGKAKRIRILLQDTLTQGDGIRFLGAKEDQGCMVNKIYKKGLLVKEAYKGDCVEIEYSGYVEKDSMVVKTSDKKQLEAVSLTYTKPQRKVALRMQVEMHIGAPFCIHIEDEEGFTCSVESKALVEKAVSKPLDKERIEKQCRKCGDTIFMVDTLSIAMDEQSTLSIKEINEVRRSALAILTEKRQLRTLPKRIGSYHREPACEYKKQCIAVAHTRKQAEILCTYPNMQVFVEGMDTYRALREEGYPVQYHAPRVMKQTYPKETCMFCEAGGIAMEQGIADHFVNVTNSYAAAFLFSHGVQGIVVSSELSKEEYQQLKQGFWERYGKEGNFIVFAYGREELMISEYCVIQACYGKTKKNCGLCRGKARYYLQDIQGHRYPLVQDEACRMHLLEDEAVDAISMYQGESLLLTFYDETIAQINEICTRAAI